ncbi:MAG: S-layer homology domain-containing protein, partial [Chloroflexia bacterium]
YFDRTPYSSSSNLKRITRPGVATATPTAVPPTATNTTVPPTATRTNTPIFTSTRTATTAPTNTPTNSPTRTNTATLAPTQTIGGNTATPVPTNTNTAVPTSTNTSVPATSTDTVTPVEPTGTGTSVPPTPTVLPTSTACTLAFADVPPNSTFYSYIQCLACKGIISGYACGSAGEPCNVNNDPYFRPGNNITRGQIAKIVANAGAYSDEIPLSTQTYQDVAPGSTFWVYIERLSLYQIMQGYACGSPGEPCGIDNKPYFRPAANATRGQIAKIVSNAAGFNDMIQPGTQTFEDVQEGSTFHVFVERLLLNRPGVMSGYPCGGIGEPCGSGNKPYFRPAATATRGQLSKIVSNTFFPDCVDTVNVLVQDFAFHPNAVTVVAGTTVRFINRDLDYHTATADDSSFNTDRIYQNQFVDVTFNTPGSYGYYCQPHPYMRGTINVISANK